MFFVLNDIDIASYLDDSTPYMVANNVDDLITSLEQESNALFEWFRNNLLKSNADKCHLLVSTNGVVSIGLAGYKIDNSDAEKPLGAKFGKKLTFDDYIFDIRKKAGRKIPALDRVTPYMEIMKKCILMNAFFYLAV